jgi:Stage II sporulation protein E (SpoIIE)
VVHAGRLSIGLIAVALAGVAVAPANADITIDVPGVAQATVPTPPVEVPVPGHGPLKVQPPNVQVTVPRSGGRPGRPVDPGKPVTTPPVPTPPVATPPVATPPTPDPSADAPQSSAANDPPAADAQTGSSTTTATTNASHSPAAKVSPAAQSHTVAPITRSGHSAPRHRAPKAAPHRAVAKPAVIASPTTAARRTGKHAPHPTAATPKQHVEKPRAPKTISTAIGDVVDRLPGWVLGIFVGFAALAVAMAINAYVSSRRARRLAAQRAELVDDVGHLQAALLASVPATPGDAAFSVAYRPAAGLAAGGDFYDVFALDDHRTAIVLGDVSGHGRESVAHAALVRYTLRTFLAAGHGPAEAIALTDPCLDGHMDGQFATVVAAVYDHVAHAITYATAGHYPPLLLGVGDDPPRPPAVPPIGAGLGGMPADIAVSLPPGASVCFFTDGLVEARRAGQPLGTERVAEMLAEAPDDAEALIAAIADEADGLNDDLAVCLLHRVAEPVELTFEPAEACAAEAVA